MSEVRGVTAGTTGIDLGVEGLGDPVLIGQGGFGAVYRAEQPALGRTVAVKILSAPGMDEGTRTRFERECVAIGALSGHPHIVTVFDSGINAWGRPFIVMDFMSRGSIADRLALDGAMPWPEAVDTGVKICGAVASAHAAGILHRDIKPQNVLVSAYGEPKLGDFGISSIGGDHTNSGTITASLEHAAPELLDGAPASVAADVYALASTVYTMVAGQAPFVRHPDEPIQSLISRILTERVPDLRPRGVPGALCDVLERGLDKDPSRRYASTTELADALREVQEQQGLVATTIVQTEAAGGFDLLDRFAPGEPRTTAPTRARVRNEYVPVPPPPEAPVPRWKRPLFVAAAVFVLLAVAASAFALTRRNEPDPPAPEVVAEHTPDAASRVGEPRTTERKPQAQKKERRKRPVRKAAQGSNSFVGGSGSSYVPPSGSSSYSSGPSTTTSGGSGKTQRSGNDSGGKTEPKEEKPQYPPAPDTELWHAVKGDDHAVGIDQGVRTQYAGRGYAIRYVGKVYGGPQDGTRLLHLHDGHRAYAFASPSGRTSPQTSRIQLWRMSKGTEFFYTADPNERSDYVGAGWAAGEYGWVAP